MTMAYVWMKDILRIVDQSVSDFNHPLIKYKFIIHMYQLFIIYYSISYTYINYWYIVWLIVFSIWSVMETGVVTRSKGSSYIEMGSTKIICAWYVIT